MNIIEFNDVWKKFRRGEKLYSLRDAIPAIFRRVFAGNGLKREEFWALENVNFQMEKGDVLGIIGPNGAGKSTILKLLSRVMLPNKGEIKIAGRISALIEVSAGFHPDLTGRENVYLNGTILGMRKREIDQKFEQIVEFSGINEFIDTPVKRYSSGMYARLGFSVAAHMDPDILLVDEVLAVGDMAFQSKCAQKMRELLNGGATIILVSHNLSLVQNLCKRVILLDKGKITQDGTSEEVIPYYENIVFKQRETEFKKKVSSDYFVKVNTDLPVTINNVYIYDGANKQKDNFEVGESISIKIDFKTKERIDNPVFALDIIRADGVLCCSSNTKDSNFSLGTIDGKGSIKIDLGKINLAPGIYVAKVSVWDKDILQPYLIRKKDIFRIKAKELKQKSITVFLPSIKWELLQCER